MVVVLFAGFVLATRRFVPRRIEIAPDRLVVRMRGRSAIAFAELAEIRSFCEEPDERTRVLGVRLLDGGVVNLGGMLLPEQMRAVLATLAAARPDLPVLDAPPPDRGLAARWLGIRTDSPLHDRRARRSGARRSD